VATVEVVAAHTTVDTDNQGNRPVSGVRLSFEESRARMPLFFWLREFLCDIEFSRHKLYLHIVIRVEIAFSQHVEPC
jgi:hypothetical protein